MSDLILVPVAVIPAALVWLGTRVFVKPELPVVPSRQLETVDSAHVHERDCIVNGEWACQACWDRGVLTPMPREVSDG